MKIIKNGFLLVFLSGIFILGCSKSHDNNVVFNEASLVFDGQMISHTGCVKSYSGKDIEETDYLACVEYSYDIPNRRLHLFHTNAYFNCCPDSLYSIIELIGDTILIQEFEKEALCDCMCFYDLSFEMNGLPLKKYYIRILKPYVNQNQPEIEFLFDPNNAFQGVYCVTR
jgi:hypothetical protein